MAQVGGVISHWHTLIDGFNTSALEFYKSVEEAVRVRAVPDAVFSRVHFKEGGLASARREYLRIGRAKVNFDLCAAPFGTGYFFSWWLTRATPAHPWLWLFGFFLAFMLWFLMLSAVGAKAVKAYMFAQGGSGFFFLAFLMLLLGFPTLLIFLGWLIRNGNFLIEEEDVLAIPVVGWLYDKLFAPATYYRLDTALMFQESVRRAVSEVIDGLLSGQGLRALSEEERRPSIRDLAG